MLQLLIACFGIFLLALALFLDFEVVVLLLLVLLPQALLLRWLLASADTLNTADLKCSRSPACHRCCHRRSRSGAIVSIAFGS